MNETRPRFLTIDAFRRGYFAPGSRPRRCDVRGWIDEGRLPAIQLDGRVYVREDDVKAFFAGARIQDHAAEKASAAVKARAARIQAARATLAQFGL